MKDLSKEIPKDRCIHNLAPQECEHCIKNQHVYDRLKKFITIGNMQQPSYEEWEPLVYILEKILEGKQYERNE